MKHTLLSDVDGCAVDLMGDGPHEGGLCGYIFHKYGEKMWHKDITRFYIHTSPELQELDRAIPGGIANAFNEYMAIPDVYQRWAKVMPGAQDALLTLNTRVQVLFITSVEAFPDSYPSKHRMLNQLFPDIQIMAIPSRLKYGYRADWGIDDRYDTCQSWERVRCQSFLFKAPWNEAPEGTVTYSWEDITRHVEAFLDVEEQGLLHQSLYGPLGKNWP
jgi:5'(3')-deoxyribonucleotidase